MYPFFFLGMVYQCSTVYTERPSMESSFLATSMIWYLGFSWWHVTPTSGIAQDAFNMLENLSEKVMSFTLPPQRDFAHWRRETCRPSDFYSAMPNPSSRLRVLSHTASSKGCYANRSNIWTWSSISTNKAQSLNPPYGFNPWSHGASTTMETHISNGHETQEDSQEPSRSHGVTVHSVNFNWCTVRVQLETFEKTEGIAIDLGLLLFPWRFSWIRNLQFFSGQPTIHPCHLHLNSPHPEIQIFVQNTFHFFPPHPTRLKLEKLSPRWLLWDEEDVPCFLLRLANCQIGHLQDIHMVLFPQRAWTSRGQDVKDLQQRRVFQGKADEPHRIRNFGDDLTRRDTVYLMVCI